MEFHSEDRSSNGKYTFETHRPLSTTHTERMAASCVHPYTLLHSITSYWPQNAAFFFFDSQNFGWWWFWTIHMRSVQNEKNGIFSLSLFGSSYFQCFPSTRNINWESSFQYYYNTILTCSIRFTTHLCRRWSSKTLWLSNAMHVQKETEKKRLSITIADFCTRPFAYMRSLFSTYHEQSFIFHWLVLSVLFIIFHHVTKYAWLNKFLLHWPKQQPCVFQPFFQSA